MAKGFLYIALNKSMPGLLKIGRTSRIPDARMSELFSTGVPEPFEILYYALTSDVKADEARVHALLAHRRNQGNREFFAVDCEGAISAVEHTCDIEHAWRGDSKTIAMGPRPSAVSQRWTVHTDSRHGVETEEQELSDFVKALESESLDAFVVSAFYDSKSCCCTFELANGVDQFSILAERIRETAQSTIRQFEWFGSIGHGRRGK